MKTATAAIMTMFVLAGCAPPPGHVVDKDLRNPPIDSLAARQACLQDGMVDGSPAMARCMRLKAQFVTASENCLGTSRRVSMDTATSQAYLACMQRRAPEATAYERAKLGTPSGR